MDNQYTYDFNNSEVWRRGMFDNKELAINAAVKEIKADISWQNKLAKRGALVSVTKVSEFKIAECIPRSIPSIDLEQMLENIDDNYHTDAGESADGEYLFEAVTNEQQDELENALNKVFYAWCESHSIGTNTYEVENIEIIKVDSKGDVING